MEGFEQKSDVLGIKYEEDHSGCCAEKRPRSNSRGPVIRPWQYDRREITEAGPRKVMELVRLADYILKEESIGLTNGVNGSLRKGVQLVMNLRFWPEQGEKWNCLLLKWEKQ